MLRNCSECNSIFVHPVNTLCAKCIRKRNEQFNAVKEYLRKNPNSRLQQVVHDTGISLERVKEFASEGRLKVVPIDFEMRCQICGAAVTSGRICHKCQEKLGQKASQERDTDQPKSGQMHLLSSRHSKKE